MHNLALKLKSSTWKCFSYVSIFYVCLKYLKEANEKEAWFILVYNHRGYITVHDVHGYITVRLWWNKTAYHMVTRKQRLGTRYLFKAQPSVAFFS